MQSVADSASERCIVSNVAYLPVPTIRRSVSICEPMRSGASVSGSEAAVVTINADCNTHGAPDVRPALSAADLSTTDKRNDFQPVAVGKRMLSVPRARYELQIQL